MNRRRMLTGMGGVALALPFLEGLAPRGAAGATKRPRRFAVFMTFNGFERKDFFPEAMGDFAAGSFTGKSIEPLAGHMGHLTVVRGLKGAPDRPVDAHGQGATRALTGSPLTMEGALGPSIDQEIVRLTDGPTGVPLTLRVGRLLGSTQQVVSYAAAKQGVVGETNPWLSYRKLTGLGSAAPGASLANQQEALNRVVRRRQSVLDLCQARVDELKAAPLSADDRKRLDLYFSSLRDAEKQMTPKTGDPALVSACTLADPLVADMMMLDGQKAAAPLASVSGPLIPRVSALQIQVLAMAFACNQSRVATLAIGGAGSAFSTYNFPPLNQTLDEHDLSHWRDANDQDKHLATVRLDHWRAEQFKLLLDTLASYRDAEGTVLDNSAVVWTSEIGQGNHESVDIPFLVAGGFGGALTRGRQVDYGKAGPGGIPLPHTSLWLSFLRAFDPQAAGFGVEEGRATSPLPDFLGS